MKTIMKLIFPNSIWNGFRLDYRMYTGWNKVGGFQFVQYEFYKWMKEHGYNDENTIKDIE